MSVLSFLADPAAPVSTVRGPRALTREERAWLDAVPAVPVIEFAGQACTWARAFFCAWVRHSLEHGIASVRTAADGSLVATMPAGLHRIDLAAQTATGPLTRAGRKPSTWRGGTYAAHCAPRD